MKKIIIAAISAIAVIASVIGCQIYDSQTNANLYRNGVKLQDLTADFNDACKALIDNSIDQSAYNKIMDYYIDFTEYFWEKTAMNAVNSVVAAERNDEMDAFVDEYNDEVKAWNKAHPDDKKKAISKKTDERYVAKQNELAARDKANMHKFDWCKKVFKEKCIKQDELYAAMKGYAKSFYKADKSLKTKEEKAAAEDRFIRAFANYEDFSYDWNWWDRSDVKKNIDGGEWTLSELWEKTYKLRWDYNSKK